MIHTARLTRRDVMRLAGAALFAGTRPAGGAEVSRLRAEMPLVVDSSVSCKDAAEDLEKLGVKAVLRYYAREKQAGFDSKILTAAEANVIFDHHIGIALCYQHENGRIGSFDQKAAEDAAAYCLGRDARGGKDPRGEGLIKHPDGSVIYFGIDSDFESATKLNNGRIIKNDEIILAYFGIIGERFKNSPFRVGVYGPGRFCRLLAKNRLASHFWLPGSTGWAQTPDFYNGKRDVPAWTIYQKAVEVPVANIRVDINILNPKADGLIGAFGRAGLNAPLSLIGPLENSSILSKERFLNRDETFRETPAGKPIVRNVEVERKIKSKKIKEIAQRDYVDQRKMVTFLESSSDNKWAKIEGIFTEKNSLGESERGVIRHGYVRTDSLASIDLMPE